MIIVLNVQQKLDHEIIQIITITQVGNFGKKIKIMYLVLDNFVDESLYNLSLYP